MTSCDELTINCQLICRDFIIIQDQIIHNKDLTNNNNYFNRSPVPRHDSRQLRVDYITAMWKHSDTRSVYVYVVV